MCVFFVGVLCCCLCFCCCCVCVCVCFLCVGVGVFCAFVCVLCFYLAEGLDTKSTCLRLSRRGRRVIPGTRNQTFSLSAPKSSVWVWE